MLALFVPNVENKSLFALIYASSSPAKCTAETDEPAKKLGSRHADTLSMLDGRCSSSMLEFPHMKLLPISDTLVDDRPIVDSPSHPLNALS